jgi:hypothetical protein
MPGKPPVKKAADEPHWESPSPTAEELLAQKTAAYVKQWEAAGNTPDPVASDPSQVQFNNSPKSTSADPGSQMASTPPAPLHQHRQRHPENATDPAKSPATAPGPNRITPENVPSDPNQTAHVTALGQAAQANPLSDVPQTLPESADFALGKSSGIEPLEMRLQKRARENAHDIAAQLDLQLYAMLKDDPSPELASVTLLPHDDRELVNALVDGVSDFRSAVREDQTMLQAKKIRPLLEMADRLRSQANLSVPTVALCRRVEGFGKYDPITPPRFPAGRENKVIVYCEVENFLSQLNDNQQWETRLTQQVTIFSDSGQMVWNDKQRPITDQCRKRRHDFYAYEVLRLPPDLTIGRYLLKVTITDENAGKVAEETVPVSIGAE